jgi:tetratricopeptide (TPR) repeat protein
VNQHAFVALPPGIQEGIDFDRVYADYLRPALEAAGLEVLRAEEGAAPGAIPAETLQALLVADLVVAELTLDRPELWYQLGVRQALRARGVILVHGRRDPRPIDTGPPSGLRYGLKDGAPDPATREEDRRRLTALARATLDAWAGQPASPVFRLLPRLAEPDWRSLLLPGEDRYGASLRAWHQRLANARRQGLAGDLLLLAGEAPTFALGLEARRAAGHCLRRLGQDGLALEQFEHALAVAPDDLPARRGKGRSLAGLGRHDEAAAWTGQILADHPADAATRVLQGEVAHRAWLARWLPVEGPEQDRRAAATAALPLLHRAVAAYEQAFVLQPGHHRAAAQATLLAHLARFLAGRAGPDPALAAREGGLAWACWAARARDPEDLRPRLGLAGLALLRDTPARVTAAYREALAGASTDGPALEAARQTLAGLQRLAFRPAAVAAALAEVDRAISRRGPPRPRQVLLFSGHMIDAPDRPVSRFPPQREAAAAAAIAARLDQLDAGPGDLALTQGACGGDILFAEACLARGVRLELLQPFDEAGFLARSVAFAGAAWVDRYHAVAGSPGVTRRPMPDALGPTPAGANPFERCNLWLLYTALAWGPQAVRFIALWNGQGGDGPGGTRHLVEAVRAHAGRVVEIRTDRLWPGPAPAEP